MQLETSPPVLVRLPCLDHIVVGFQIALRHWRQGFNLPLQFCN
jgi:hypothetical protein